MKTILLLSALAVPMLMAAQVEDNTGDAQDPSTSEATVVALTTNTLSYTMPAGTFFPVNDKMPALLPPVTPLNWNNTSYTTDDQGDVVLWSDGNFSWYNNGYKLGGDFDLTTPATSAYGTLGLFTTVVPAPVLNEATSFYSNDEGNAVFYQGTAGVTFTAPGCQMASGLTYYPFNKAQLTEIAANEEVPGAKEAFTYNIQEGGFSNLWSTVGDGNSTLSGFAQYVTFPGRNYVLTSITIPGLTITEGGSVSVVVYQADGTTLGKVIKRVRLTSGNTADIYTLIEGDVVIAVQDIEIDQFSPVIYGKSWINGRELPAENQGLYAIATSSTGTPSLVEWVAPAEEDVEVTLDGEQLDGTFYQNTLAVAMGVEVGVYYPYILPVSMIGGSNVDGTETVEVALNSITSAASYRVISSQMPSFSINAQNEEVPSIIVTTADGSDVPSWLRVTINTPDADGTDDKGNVAFPDPNYTTLQTAANRALTNVKYDGAKAESQYMVVSFALVSDVEASTTVKLTVPGNESCTFLVNANIKGGVADAIASEAQVVAREYFDLQGRRLSEAPANGFFIEKVTRADGTTAATRIMR